MNIGKPVSYTVSNSIRDLVSDSVKKLVFDSIWRPVRLLVRIPINISL